MTASWKSADRHTPSQAELDSMIQAANRIHITEIRPLQGQPGRSGVLFESTNRREIAQLQQCLQILEDPQTFGWCMCAGDLAVIFSRGKDSLARISLHHGLSIRWDQWKFDARLVDGSKSVNWLADHGIPHLKQQREDALRQSEEARKASDRWYQAMPECLRSYTSQIAWSINPSSPDLVLLRQALEQTYPDPVEQARVLFKWFGQGQGPWSGIPSYEVVPEMLLLGLPVSVLIQALDGFSVGSAEMEGAARYFAGWYFHRHIGSTAQLLPSELKRRLMEHVVQSGDADKLARAREFGG